MADIAPSSAPPKRLWWRVPVRLACLLLLAFVLGWTMNRISATLERSSQPAGFARGMLQGALMPMAMPNLLLGKDVVIYSPANSGLTYKLGYTLGVNVCGLLFFGFFFWRLSRWRKRLGKGYQ